MAVKAASAGAAQLKKDIQQGSIQNCYIIYGEESYLKEYYLQALIQKTVDEAFLDFNYQRFEGKELTPEQFTEAVDSYPAMAERRLILIRDFDLYKAPAAMKDSLLETLADLPPYLCLVFYYDILELKTDKRQKIHALLSKNACFAEFTHLAERELMDWIRRRLRALGKGIADTDCAYFIFYCGNDMTQLAGEIEKAAAFCTVEAVTKYHIDMVCTRVLSAAIFDLTDALADQNFTRCFTVLQELIAQKNDEIQIFSTIIRHLQRMYAAKLAEQEHAGEAALMNLLNAKSSFYVRKITSSARKLPLTWLRTAILLCAQTDAQLKSSVTDKKRLIELTLLQLEQELQ